MFKIKIKLNEKQFRAHLNVIGRAVDVAQNFTKP